MPSLRLLCILAILLSFCSFAAADGGFYIFEPDIEAHESAQNAIVAWDGETEILILSIDASTPRDSIALQIIPLPSDPELVEETEFSTFENIADTFDSKFNFEMDKFSMPGFGALAASEDGYRQAALEITFSEIIGGHSISVVKVNDVDFFLEWIRNFADRIGEEGTELSPEFKQTVREYITNGKQYFVFDYMDFGSETKSVKPILFKFKSEELYYPLKITSASMVSDELSELNIFLIAKGMPAVPEAISQFDNKGVSYEIEDLRHFIKENPSDIPDRYLDERYYSFASYDSSNERQENFEDRVEFSYIELQEVHHELASLFPQGALVSNILYFGSFRSFDKDIEIGSEQITEFEFSDQIASAFSFQNILIALSSTAIFWTVMFILLGFALLVILPLSAIATIQYYPFGVVFLILGILGGIFSVGVGVFSLLGFYYLFKLLKQKLASSFAFSNTKAKLLAAVAVLLLALLPLGLFSALIVVALALFGLVRFLLNWKKRRAKK